MINSVVIIGYVANEVKVKYSGTETPYISIYILIPVPTPYGKPKRSPKAVNIGVFGEKALKFAKVVKQKDLILVSGHLDNKDYYDRENRHQIGLYVYTDDFVKVQNKSIFKLVKDAEASEKYAEISQKWVLKEDLGYKDDVEQKGKDDSYLAFNSKDFKDE